MIVGGESVKSSLESKPSFLDTVCVEGVLVLLEMLPLGVGVALGLCFGPGKTGSRDADRAVMNGEAACLRIGVLMLCNCLGEIRCLALRELREPVILVE